MRFMMIVKSNSDSEAGAMPTAEDLIEMGNYNEELIKAGVMLAGDGLLSSAKGFRVKYDGDKRTVVDGPFTETKELVAGFWIIQVKSKEEALQWARRVPFKEGELEVRQVAEASDFAPALADSPEGLEVLRKEEEFRQRSHA